MQENTNDTASRVNAIIERVGRSPEKLVPVLEAAQDEFHYLPEDVMMLVAEGLGVSPAKVYGVATFYAYFSLERKGKHVIRCCDGTACHVKGSMGVMKAIRDELGLKDGEKTTKDGKFSIETVYCLGACGLAPVVFVGDKVHGQSTPKTAVEFIKSIDD
jgi:NADH-quinone oxidoreductase subunit E